MVVTIEIQCGCADDFTQIGFKAPRLLRRYRLPQLPLAFIDALFTVTRILQYGVREIAGERAVLLIRLRERFLRSLKEQSKDLFVLQVDHLIL